MLRLLHMKGPVDMIEIAHETGFPHKRVREQITRDLRLGIVEQVSVSHIGGSTVKYRLTREGGLLLSRFIEYRKSHSLPLPTIEEARGETQPIAEDETEEASMT